MVRKTAGLILSFFQIESRVDEQQVEVCQYGMEIMISTLLNMIFILLIGMAGGAVWESILFLFCFSFLRRQTGGYHAGSYLTCNLTLICCYSGLLWFYKMTVEDFGLSALCIAGMLHFLIWFFWMPVEHENKPLSERQRSRARAYSLCIFAAYAALSVCFLTWNCREGLMLMYSVMLTDILALVSIVKKHKKGKRRIFKNEERKSNQQTYRSRNNEGCGSQCR